MRLTIHLLGVEVFAIATGLTSPEPDDDTARDLSGGNLGCDRIDAGPTEMFVGFANGREAD